MLTIGDGPTLPRLLIIAEESKRIKELLSELTRSGFTLSIAHNEEGLVRRLTKQTPDLVLVETDSHFRVQKLIQKIKQEKHLPIIALGNREMLDDIGADLAIDDFILKPYDVKELALRAKKLLSKTNHRDNTEVLNYDDLVIDLAKCEVTLAGRLVALTFKEYELLKFLTSNRGRVFTREALLNKIWGHDYYGGDRTVDVHIRRLRSKTEDATHTFIETVRNIGYRFKE